jgi:ATP-dependent Zn protease
MGGRAAEKLVLRGRPSPAMDDYRQAAELAAIICTSPKSITRSLKFCEQQAEDLLKPHIDLIFALVPELRARRTMTGAEVDEAIASALTRLDLAAEQKRRRQWQQRIANSRDFPGDDGMFGGASQCL